MGVEYHLRIAEPHTHLVEVEVRVPSVPDPAELVLASWTPGSYLIREFSRHVQDLEAHDSTGLPLATRKIAKNRWRVEPGVEGPLVVRYRVYANELTVRTSHVDASHAFINGASVFMYVESLQDEPVRLRIQAPPEWRVATSLHETESGDLLAADYHELVDCPIELGTHRTIAWVQEGVPHRIALWGPGEIDEKRLTADIRRIIETCSRMFGGVPYERYLFIVHVVPEGRGGLEHATSCSLHISPSWLHEPDYERFLALVAHELFHVWLGKRIRPSPLGPFDYSAENYTRHLWVVEGFTTYYTDRILLRAGLMSASRYLERLGDSIARLQALPGRRHQTLEESSFDAWIRFYRPDAHTPNSQVSYYHKGSLVAAVLDLEIRRASDGTRSLDDVMRTLWARFGARDIGFSEEEGIDGVVEEIGGAEVTRLLARYVRSTEEIDFDEHLAAAGIELVEPPSPATADAPTGMRAPGHDATEDPASPDDFAPGPSGRPLTPPPAAEWRLGLRLIEEAGRLRVTHVLEGSAASAAGVNAGDELVAFAGRGASLAWLERQVSRLPVGGRVELHVLRREHLLHLGIVVPANMRPPSRLRYSPEASESEARIRREWLQNDTS